MAPGRSKQSALSLFGGVPLMIAHDRTRTAGRRHVVPEGAVPLHPEAVVLAGNVDHLAVNAPSPPRFGVPSGNNRSISTRYASVNGTPGRRSGDRKASPQRMPDRGRLGRFS